MLIQKFENLIGKRIKIGLYNTGYRSMLAGRIGIIEQVIGGNIGIRFENILARNKSGLFWFDYTNIEKELEECIDQ